MKLVSTPLRKSGPDSSIKAPSAEDETGPRVTDLSSQPTVNKAKTAVTVMNKDGFIS